LLALPHPHTKTTDTMAAAVLRALQTRSILLGMFIVNSYR
jgi:hypothetical protein